MDSEASWHKYSVVNPQTLPKYRFTRSELRFLSWTLFNPETNVSLPLYSAEEIAYQLRECFPDILASLICRKKPYKRIGRYDKEKGEIDFQQLAQAIEQNQHSAFKLYNYIYQSKELRRLVESLNYGHNSLRNHLLMMVNLAINDYYSGKLTIKNEKITIKRKNYKGKVSQSAKHKEEVFIHVKDAETHLSLTMNNADSERATTSKKRRLGA
ncbi:MAG: hypothetical protein GNW80_12670 [Asgard group archaeon]|nr:hypothetical protein [Asgard group archaeon]